MSVRWGVLGGPWVSVGETPIALAPRSRFVLAALLRSPGRPVTPDRLVRSADSTSTRSVNAARVAVSRLRATLSGTPAGPAVVTTPNGYAIEADPTTVDHLVFGALIGEAEATHWPGEALRSVDAALALWKGDPFGELRTDPAFMTDAAALEERHRAAVDRWCELSVQVRPSGSLIGAVEAAIAAEPLRERRWAALVLAHYRAGNQAAAVRAYDRVRTVLRDELGLEPGPELQRLVHGVLEQRPDLEWKPERVRARPIGAPAITRPAVLLGRDSEIHDLLEVLHRRRIVVVTGYGGIGKTAFALEVAVRSERASWAVPLADVRDPARLVATVARTTGIAADGPHLIERIAAQLDEVGGLLLLDNCEHLASDVAHLVDRLAALAPNARIVATSRVELDLGGAYSLALGPLAVGTRVEPGPAALIAADAAAIRPSAIAEHWSTIETLCRRADGVPLVIELLGAAHAEGSDPGTGAQVGLGDAVVVATESLPGDSRLVVDVLRSLHAEVGVKFLAALTGLGDDVVRRAIGPAVRTGLAVQRWAPGGAARVRLLEPARDVVAADRSMLATLVEDVHRAFRALADQAIPSAIGAIEVDTAVVLDDEHDLMLWALDNLDDGDRLEMACLLAGVWRACGRHVDGARIIASLEPVANRSSAFTAGRYWLARAQVAASLADNVPLVGQLRSTVEVCAAQGARDLYLRAKSELAIGLGWSGALTEAEALVGELYREVPAGNRWAEISLDGLASLGRAAAGEHARAAAELVEIARAFRGVGHGGDVAGKLYMAAALANVAGAHGLLRTIFDETEAVEHDRFSAFALAALAYERARWAMSQRDQVTGALLWEAFGQLRVHGEQRVAGLCRRDLGVWRVEHGDDEGAEDLAAAALLLLDMDPRAAAVAIAHLVETAAGRRDPDEAQLLAAAIDDLAGRSVGVPLTATELRRLQRARPDGDPQAPRPEELIDVLRRWAVNR